MQKLYNKIHLNNAFAIMFFFYLLCISVLLLLIKYYFHALARLVCHVFKVFFSKMKLVQTLLHTQLKQNNLENQLSFQQKVQKNLLMILLFQHLKFASTVNKC